MLLSFGHLGVRMPVYGIIARLTQLSAAFRLIGRRDQRLEYTDLGEIRTLSTASGITAVNVPVVAPADKLSILHMYVGSQQRS